MARGPARTTVLALLAASLLAGCSSRTLPVTPPPGGAGASGTAGDAAGASGAAGDAAGASGAAGGGAGASGADGGGAGTSGGAAGGGSAGAAGSVVTGMAGGAGSIAGSGGGVMGLAGFTGILGQGGSGGAATDCKDPCPALKCDEGSAPVMDPALPCCPVCKSVKCAGMTCPTLSCLSNTHPELTPGQCCAACVPGSGTCDQARSEYMQADQAFRAQLAGPCQTDADCTYTVENNGCVTDCFIPLARAGAAMFEAALHDSGLTCNVVCGTPQPTSCTRMTVVCLQGRCATKP
jgi:hypothetical protein